MRSVILVSLWISLLGITAAVASSAWGMSFFYFERRLQDPTAVVNEWLFSLWMVVLICCLIFTIRTSRLRRGAALVYLWAVAAGPFLLAVVYFIESRLTRDSTLARYHRMECVVALVIGLLLQARSYYAMRQTPQSH